MPIEGQNEIGTRAKIVVAEASVSMRHYVSVRLFGWCHFLSIHVSIDFFLGVPGILKHKLCLLVIQGSTKLSARAQMRARFSFWYKKTSNAKKESYCSTEP